MWSFGLLCLEVFTGADPYRTSKDYYVPILLSQGKPPENPGTAAVGLSPKMWELMQSCWEVDPAERPDMFKIQLAMRDILLRFKIRPTVMARRPSTSPVLTLPLRSRISQPLVPTRVSPTVGDSSAHETKGSSSASSSLSIPAPSPPSGGQVTLEASTSIPSPRPSPSPELEGTWTLNKGTPLGSQRLPPLREDNYELHSAGISMSPMAPPQISRSSSRPSGPTATTLFPHPTVASDFPIRTIPTPSPSQSSTSPGPDEPVAPKRKFSLWKRSQSRTLLSQWIPATAPPPKPPKSKLTSRNTSQTNPAETLKAVPSRSSTILPTLTTTRKQVPASEDCERYGRDRDKINE